MSRAVLHLRRNQLKKIGDEIETVLVFSKRLAFQVFDAAILLCRTLELGQMAAQMTSKPH
jgi:hypothetical protein